MAWHQDQQRVRPLRQQGLVGREDDFVLAGMGTGGDPYRPIPGAPLPAQCGSAVEQGRVDTQVELDRAGHPHALRPRAQGTETLGLGLGLHGDPAQLRQHRRGELVEARITTGRALGQAGIGQHHRDAAHGALVDMVGPEFGLHDHRQPRPRTVEEARRRPGQVIGQVAVLHPVAEQRLDPRRAGRRHAGDGDRQVGIARQQLADQRRRGDAFAERHGMHPDAALAHGRQAEGETLADAPAVGRRPPGAPEQAQTDDGQGQVQKQGIERSIHGRAA
ncbi:hypothetical protein D3C84_706680 [compost metagenome]